MNGDSKATLADEEIARQLQEEEDAMEADERMARQLQSQLNMGGPPQDAPSQNGGEKLGGVNANPDTKASSTHPFPYAPPPGTPPAHPPTAGGGKSGGDVLPTYAKAGAVSGAVRPHTNALIQAATVRAKDEQHMQNWLQTLQFKYRIYNSELEPEHEADYPCSCEIHHFMRAKWARTGVQDMWSHAVLYPGEKAYTGNNPYTVSVFSGNPYQYRTMSPYLGTWNGGYGPKMASPRAHATWTTQTIALNAKLNDEAQRSVDNKEPKFDVWGDGSYEGTTDSKQAGVTGEKEGGTGYPVDKKGGNGYPEDKKGGNGYPEDKKGGGTRDVAETASTAGSEKKGKFSGLRKSLGIKSGEERRVVKHGKAVGKGFELRDQILEEEAGRWQNDEWRAIVKVYQEKTGMAPQIAYLRAHKPIQYFHLLRAGYFEPIPVAWANQASNPLKFSIDASNGWRGVTPAWRGYEDTAEERLYWVLNHRIGSTGTRLKPDFISALNLARERMATAVEPPPEYFDPNDTCHVQHTTDGYSKQVMPPPFRPFDRPETANDDTMILLDVSGSMDFVPQRPIYDRYLVTGYQNSTQPKNKDVAKAIVRRFTDAMMNHDHATEGYDLTTFSNSASYIGPIHHRNFDHQWNNIHFGGGTRVMTGWQKVKDLHFQKHSHSAIHHPVYGWQAGPDTPMLRLLLLLDGEATDMDEFELDLLGLSWAHVTIFLIGVDGCPHHHRHANELQRISDVNHHVSFVDAQGNTPERFVTHELLKRHLGYDISMSEFKRIEVPPSYDQAVRA